MQQEWDADVQDDCRQLIRLAIREDLSHGYDWTTVSLVPEVSDGRAAIVAREPGIAAGLPVIPLILEETHADLQWQAELVDGAELSPGSCLGYLSGSARDLLTTERTLLNFVGHLSGVATLTAAYVSQVAGTAARIYDTRKTHPGYRRLEKYAVRCGGATNHRSGLYEAIMIKDNHLAFARQSDEANCTPADAVERARAFINETLPGQAHMIIEVEVDTLTQFEQVLDSQADIVLLDNMSLDELRKAVDLRNHRSPDLELEASGGVTLETVRQIAETGIDRISVGALTHSARCLDVGLDWLAHHSPAKSPSSEQTN